MSRRRLLIVSSDQFGYHTDSYSYCRHLRPSYEITYLGWDYALPRIELDGVRVIDVPRRGGRLRRTVRLAMAARREARRGGYDAIVVVYFRGCSMMTWLGPRLNVLMDVRSGCVHASKRIRAIENWLIRRESRRFQHLSVISESLRDYLGLEPLKTSLLRVGGEEWTGAKARSAEMRLLYVGTLNFRDIDRTVEGFARFRAALKDPTVVQYDIVGGGDEDVRRRLEEAIARCGCPEAIRYHGRKRYTDLIEFFARGTIGVAFFPRYEFFEFQPVTKVFEYLLAGMPVIATRTFENERVISPANGVLCDDTPEGFCRALGLLHERWGAYDPAAIQRASEEYSWRAIVQSDLLPILERLCTGARVGRRA